MQRGKVIGGVALAALVGAMAMIPAMPAAAASLTVQKDVCVVVPADCDPLDDSVWADSTVGGVGATIVFRVRVVNTFTSPETIVVDDSLPVGLAYVGGSAQVSQGDATGFPAIWDAGELAAGASAWMTFQATFAADADVTNVADATATDNDFTIAVGADGASVEIAAPALSLAVVANPPDAHPGDTVTFSFTVGNTGNVTVSDPQLTVTAFTGSGGALAPVCPAGPIAVGGSVVCTAPYVVATGDVGRTVSVTGIASATATLGEDPASEQASALTAVTAEQELAATGFAAPVVPALALVALGVLAVVAGRQRVSSPTRRRAPHSASR